MSYPTQYPYKEYLHLPTSEDPGPELATPKHKTPTTRVGGVNPWGPNLLMLANLNATEAEIKGLQNDGPITGMDGEATLIMKACDELTLKGCVRDDTLVTMKKRFGDQTVIKYILVLSWYNMFKRFAVSTRVLVENNEEVDEKIGKSTLPA
ncbi:hypothetical protein B0J14DRAFT_631063 [Halenospora varia]|nr:hypothetical protein B0J14DRAFT_631063 [Halenospora varia]